MNLGILILVAIPLAVYLVVLVFSSRDFSPEGKPHAHATETVQDTLPAPENEPAPAAASLTDENAAPPQVFYAVAETVIVPSSDQAEAEPTAQAVLVESETLPAAERTEDVSPVAEQRTETVEQPIALAAAEPENEPPSSPKSVESEKQDENQPILSGQPLILPDDSPKYAFDYRGRLWVEKKRRGFFRQLRRPQLPPEDPTNPSDH